MRNTLHSSKLGIEVGIEATEKTIQVTMKEKEIIDAIALQKPLVSATTAEKRVDRAENQLGAHGSPEDWKRVLFSDEVHFWWSDEGRVHIHGRSERSYAYSLSTQTS